METSSGYLNYHQNSSFGSSRRDVSYSCGSCGYELNLNSSSRNTASIGSKYGKSIKKGMISFLSIDESRFTQVDEFKCVPFFFSKRSWGLFQRRTKLQCRKCGNNIGIAYDNSASSYPLVADASDTASGSEITTHRKYDIKIRSLQPSSSASGTPLPEWYIMTVNNSSVEESLACTYDHAIALCWNFKIRGAF